jgi:predicted AAA+ superfamily ATPase
MASHPYTIPTENILERLRFENPWWRTSETDAFTNQMKRRPYFEQFLPLVQDLSLRRAIILMGSRRVGKTVMLHHTIQALLDNQVAPSSIFFAGIDNPIYFNMGLEELMHMAAKACGRAHLDGVYVFFDEIQYLKDWEHHLKVLVDSYPAAKFIVSGSSGAALRLKSDESGAGRFHDFMLPPLTFYEFLLLQNLQHLVQPDNEHDSQTTHIPAYRAIDIKALNEQFFSYLNYGGYPEVLFSESIRGNMQRFIKKDIIDKVLLRDLPGLYGINDIQELNRFFTYLAFNTGREFSPQKISGESGLRQDVIKRYMEYLQASFLISVVNKVDENARHFKRITGFKVYLTNLSLRTALFSPVVPTDDDAGHVVESAIYSQGLHREPMRQHYAKWKMGRSEGEVDMVTLDEGTLKPNFALEIKWSNRFVDRPSDLKSLLSFCRNNRLDRAVVTSIDKQVKIVEDGIELHFYPASVYAYALGAATLHV